MSRLTRTLSSPRLAWWLLVFLLACLLVSFLVPQRSLVGETLYSEWKGDAGFFAALAESLGFASVFTSWPFLLAMTLLFVNLAFCTTRRLSVRRRRRTRPLHPPEDAIGFVVKVDAAPEEVSLPGRAAWVLHRPAPDQFVWERGVWGWRGSILMHVGLLVLLIAGVVSGLTRFSGEVVLAEGQTLTDAPDSYTSVTQTPRLGPGFSGAALTLRDLAVTYEGSTVVDVVASMSEGEQGTVRHARVNQPFRVGGKAYLLSRSGHAVALKVTEGEDVLMDAVVNLGGVTGRGNSDSIAVREGFVVTMTVLPDGVAEGSATARRRLLLTDPVVEVQATGSDERAHLRPGQSEQVGAITVEVADVLYWTEFLARSDRGLPIAYIAFGMLLAGIVARWLDPDVRVALALSDDRSTAKVWHRARFDGAIGLRASEVLVAQLRAERNQGAD